MKTIFIFLLISLVYVSTAPFFDDDDFDFGLKPGSFDVDCTKMGCPEGSTSCSKKTTTSEDKKKITTELKCFNSAGTVLANPITIANNPYPSSISNGYEYYGSFSEGTHTTHVNQGGTSNTDQVENFTK